MLEITLDWCPFNKCRVMSARVMRGRIGPVQTSTLTAWLVGRHTP